MVSSLADGWLSDDGKMKCCRMSGKGGCGNQTIVG